MAAARSRLIVRIRVHHPKGGGSYDREHDSALKPADAIRKALDEVYALPQPFPIRGPFKVTVEVERTEAELPQEPTPA